MKTHSETVRLKPRRIYKCETCEGGKAIWERKQVIKDGDKFRCPTCGQTVIDVTNTKTGNDWMEMVAI